MLLWKASNTITPPPFALVFFIVALSRCCEVCTLLFACPIFGALELGTLTPRFYFSLFFSFFFKYKFCYVSFCSFLLCVLLLIFFIFGAYLLFLFLGGYTYQKFNPYLNMFSPKKKILIPDWDPYRYDLVIKCTSLDNLCVCSIRW